MKQEKSKRAEQHVREVVQACLNIVERKGDTYVAIHQDDDAECVVLVSLLHCYPIFSVIIADRILFSEEHASEMYRAANDLNAESLIGWHSVLVVNDTPVYMYRQCLWTSQTISCDELLGILHSCIDAYKHGRAIISGTSGTTSTRKES